MGKVKKHTGTTKGPKHLFAKLLNEIGIEVDAHHKWNVENKWTHIDEIENLKQLVRDKAKDRMWQQLSKQRHNYQGLGEGRDDEASETMGKTF